MARASKVFNIEVHDPVESSKKIDIELLWSMIRGKRFGLRTIYVIWRCYCNVFVHYPWYAQYLASNEQ